MKSIWIIPVLAVLILGVIGFSNEVYSSPIGDTIFIEVQNEGGDLIDNGNFVVGNGVEFGTTFQSGNDFFDLSIDINESQVLISYFPLLLKLK